ncbi:MAG: LptF/LptG family permease [Hoeflea sp.]|uniref:LptF/LptG family permease n=1 Tax=Hoeflea sp. TaxID=1940281 RepID=UPI001D250297|nr:LptF/LptG family permease [Hoeflea sp.]MBU4530970.1 LptF/LptG family permease [Alphaproteobacteria bacterium]MBU4542745.1 LptF/LptG family permease [Alphaproteobacteria bacterium]MBU4552557.1 LptF/LptG family permease [Alphaproteobacteria bacterium]MBV1722862.1 LptF/LptG family permease [Hoeflea sp.]MBV1762773.1 LptF/LptG family permease [Hoeflea sp.]
MTAPAPNSTREGNSIRQPFGVYTRFMVRHYLWFILVTLMAISSAVTAINVSGEITRVWAEKSAAGTLSAIAMTVYYVLLRLLDNTAQALPISVVVAVVWAETSHAASGRLVMVRTVGMAYSLRSRGLMVTALLIIAPLQFTLDNYIRPNAMLELRHNILGEYGWLHQSQQRPRMQWFSRDGHVVQAMFEGLPQVRISDVTVYEISPAGSLEAISQAERLTPASGKSSTWVLERAQTWRFDNGAGATAVSEQEATLPVLKLSQIWLGYREIHPKYVPLPDLVTLSRDEALPDNHPPYIQWLALRLVQPINTALILFCVAAVFALVLDRRGLIVAALSGLVTGYLLYLLGRISAVLVESVRINPFLSGAIFPLLLAALLILLSWVLTSKDRAV